MSLQTPCLLAVVVLLPVWLRISFSDGPSVKGGAKLDHRGGGKLDHPAVEWLKAAVRRRGQDAGAAAGWRAFLLSPLSSRMWT